MYSSIDAILRSPSVKRIEGAIVVGKLPSRADGLFSETYLHEFFPPLSRASLDLLQDEVGIKISPSLVQFLQMTNGCSLYCDSLTIFGFVESLDRCGRQPISFRQGNVMRRSKWLDSRRGALRVGSYSHGAGSDVFLEVNERVTVVGRGSEMRPVGNWKSLDEWLDAEVRRMEAVFNSHPSAIDPLNPIAAPSAD